MRHRRLRCIVGTSVVLASLLTSTSVRGSQADDMAWMPDAVANGLTMQLVGRFQTIDGTAASDLGALIADTRERVERLRTIISAWNVDGVISRAPDVKRLGLPSMLDRHIDAMLRYQVCNVVLTLQYERGRTPEGRKMGARGLTAFTAVQARLLAPFLAAGGKASAVEAVMTGAPMAAAADRIQRDPAMLEYVQTACGPVLSDLLGMVR